MGKLTTHVLDTARGCPGAGIRIELFRLADGARTRLADTTTNADGRCDAPLLEGARLEAGRYELVFQAGAYFAASGVALPEPPFVDEVVLRFGIADTAAHYHVPLLVSPWSYSTYRGS
jgi:5-hydroxyisourate hydrolase